MKKLSFAALSLLALACGRNTSDRAMSPAIPADNDLEKRVSEIVSKMSLDDKVGQMCEINIDVILADSLTFGKVTLNPEKVQNAFEKYRVGSVLNTPLGEAQDPEIWYNIISGIQDASMKYIGVPDIYGVDQNHGTTYTKGGTLFPQEINMAASFNRDLVR